jgi:hypothetical protein
MSSLLTLVIISAQAASKIFTSFAHFEAKVATRSAHRRSHGKGVFVTTCCTNHPFINKSNFEVKFLA